MNMNMDVLNAFRKKRYWQIGEIASRLGIETYTLRYWEENVPKLQPVRMRDRRLYSFEQISLIFQLHDMINVQGFTLKGAMKNLDKPHQSKTLQTIAQNLTEILHMFKKHEDALDALSG